MVWHLARFLRRTHRHRDAFVFWGSLAAGLFLTLIDAWRLG